MLWKRLTQDAKKAISFMAQEEAKRFHAEELLPEHIVMALLRNAKRGAVESLLGLKVSSKDMYRDIKRGLTVEEGGQILGDIAASERAVAHLKAAVVEATNMGQDFVGTEHLLLAAMRDESGATFRYLSGCGISMGKLRTAILARRA